MAHPVDRYLSSDYLKHNPSWDSEDGPWKADLVASLLLDHQSVPASICEVGCGAGACLAALRDRFPGAELFGFDIAPDVESFWAPLSTLNINFQRGDFFALNRRRYDIILLLDVIEHVPDPFDFLARLQGTADQYVFHLPLDLSAVSVARESPLLHVRRKVGHIHYFTKNLALALLQECGFRVLAWRYTGAAFTGPQRSLKTRLAQIPRRLGHMISKDLGVRLFGGETLLVLAEEDAPSTTVTRQ